MQAGGLSNSNYLNTSSSIRASEKETKNYAGSKTLPASIKEKEPHWPEVP